MLFKFLVVKNITSTSFPIENLKFVRLFTENGILSVIFTLRIASNCS